MGQTFSFIMKPDRFEEGVPANKVLSILRVLVDRNLISSETPVNLTLPSQGFLGKSPIPLSKVIREFERLGQIILVDGGLDFGIDISASFVSELRFRDNSTDIFEGWGITIGKTKRLGHDGKRNVEFTTYLEIYFDFHLGNTPVSEYLSEVSGRPGPRGLLSSLGEELGVIVRLRICVA